MKRVLSVVLSSADFGTDDSNKYDPTRSYTHINKDERNVTEFVLDKDGNWINVTLSGMVIQDNLFFNFRDLI